MAPVASNKPVGLQITLVFFVLTTIVLAITTYSFSSSNGQLTAAAAAAKQAEGVQKSLWQNASTDVTTLKKTIGLQPERVDDPNNQQDNTTVVGMSRLKMAEAGANAGPDMAQTITKTVAALNTTDSNRKEIVDQLKTQNEEMLSLRNRYEANELEHDKAKQLAETDKQQLIRARDEQLTAKDQEIGKLRKDYNDSQAVNANLIEQGAKERKRFTDEITRLEAINDKIREELDGLKQISFEVADGLIRRVDNSSKTVWLNIGSADRVQPRTTFSVYAKDNSGIGRGQEDIKGKIEVTRVIDAHMSEAKILEEDLYRPMAANDQIYSPLWNPGRQENFSVVGDLDLDNDGRDDRELFQQIIATAGAKIDNEVDHEGNRTGDGITEKTKFLILGDIPNIADLSSDQDRARAQKVMDSLKDLRREARLNGVRIVNLNDFLGYIGYKPKRRLFQPGQERPYNLRSGAHSTSINETIEKNRDSTGNVSDSVNKGQRQKKQDVSSGQTSKRFGPGN